MIALMKFKSRITTKESYPRAIYVEYNVEIHNCENVFEEAYEYEKKILNLKNVVSETCECLGILQISKATDSEIITLSANGFKYL